MSNAVEQSIVPAMTNGNDALAKPDRLKFGSFTFTRSPAGRCIVQVELEFTGKRFEIGRAHV